MKLRDIKIWHSLLVILLLILLLRGIRIVDSYQLLASHIKLLFTNFSLGLNQFTISHFDLYFGVSAIIIMPVSVVFFRRLRLMQKRINIQNFGFLILMSILVFAPIISTVNPNLQNNLRLNSLKPPMHQITHFSKAKQSEEPYINFKFNNGQFFNTYETSDNKTCISVKESRDGFELEMNDEIENIRKENSFDYKFSTITFILGTDELGRDIFSRLVYGTRFSIFIGASSVIVAFFIGTLIGFISGYFESGWDVIFNHVIDLFLAFPILFLILLLVSIFENSILLLVLILGLSGWMSLAKLVRGEVIEIKKQDFVTTSIQLGYTKSELLTKEFFPNLAGPIIVNLVFLFVNIVLVESSLSFLGLGIQDIYPTWGGMIQTGQEYLQSAWWISFFPAIALVLVLLYINNIGEHLKQTFDPKVEV